MAKMIEDVLVIKVSKLFRDDEGTDELVSADTKIALEQVVQELVGPGVLVEVEKA